MTPFLAFLGMGMPEMLIVLAICLLLFGAAKLPKLARAMGASVGEFKKGMKDDQDEAAPEVTRPPVPRAGTRKAASGRARTVRDGGHEDAHGARIRAVSPDGWPRPRGYSNGIVVPPGHAILHTAGMVGWDDRERIVPGGFVAQFERALDNVLAVVRKAGGGPEHVVSMTVYVADRAEYLASLGELGDAWRRTMGRNYPAMALVAVAALVEERARVEIQAVAALPAGRS